MKKMIIALITVLMASTASASPLSSFIPEINKQLWGITIPFGIGYAKFSVGEAGGMVYPVALACLIPQARDSKFAPFLGCFAAAGASEPAPEDDAS